MILGHDSSPQGLEQEFECVAEHHESPMIGYIAFGMSYKQWPPK